MRVASRGEEEQSLELAGTCWHSLEFERIRSNSLTLADSCNYLSLRDALRGELQQKKISTGHFHLRASSS